MHIPKNGFSQEFFFITSLNFLLCMDSMHFSAAPCPGKITLSALSISLGFEEIMTFSLGATYLTAFTTELKLLIP
jgi:hypothetical protein